MRLTSHDPGWADAFGSIADEICAATGLPPDRVQHVGSTAVPDLVAKPILDVDVGLRHEESVDRVVASLVDLGFIDRGVGEGGVGRLLVLESSPEVRTAHLHIVPYGSESWLHDLAFRDALRSEPALRERYADRKMRLAGRFPDDRAQYRNAKDQFFRQIGMGDR